MQSQKLPTYLLLVLVQILFGINFSASKLVIQGLNPLWFTFIRFFIAGISLLIVSFFLVPRPWNLKQLPWAKLIVSSLLGISLSQSLFIYGLKYTTTINTSLLTTLIPLFAVLIGVLRRQIEFHYFLAVGFTLSFIGVLILKNPLSANWSSELLLGNSLILLSCLFLALYLSLAKDIFSRYSSLFGSAFSFIFGSLFLTPLLFRHSFHYESLFESSIFYPVLFCIYGATLLTYLINNFALKKVNPGVVSIFIYIQPVVASIIGYFYLDEKIYANHWVGFIIIVIGVRLVIKKSN